MQQQHLAAGAGSIPARPGLTVSLDIAPSGWGITKGLSARKSAAYDMFHYDCEYVAASASVMGRLREAREFVALRLAGWLLEHRRVKNFFV